jgi:hypothetical protein
MTVTYAIGAEGDSDPLHQHDPAKNGWRVADRVANFTAGPPLLRRGGERLAEPARFPQRGADRPGRDHRRHAAD